MLGDFMCDDRKFSRYHPGKIRSCTFGNTCKKKYGFSSVNARLAMGIVEGYHCDNLMPWDVAAGVLIIREAGGVVIDTNGGEFDLMSPKVIAAGNDKLAEKLVKLISHADVKTRHRKSVSCYRLQ